MKWVKGLTQGQHRDCVTVFMVKKSTCPWQLKRNLNSTALLDTSKCLMLEPDFIHYLFLQDKPFKLTVYSLTYKNTKNYRNGQFWSKSIGCHANVKTPPWMFLFWQMLFLLHNIFFHYWIVSFFLNIAFCLFPIAKFECLHSDQTKSGEWLPLFILNSMFFSATQGLHFQKLIISFFLSK